MTVTHLLQVVPTRPTQAVRNEIVRNLLCADEVKFVVSSLLVSSTFLKDDKNLGPVV